MKSTIRLTAALALLATCVPAEAAQKKDPAVEAAMEKLAAMSVTCSDDQDCSRKWTKAVAWVSKNSAFKIQIATDNLIQTFGPSYTIHGTAFVVNKVPAAVGHVFEFRALCNSQPFCGLSERDYKASFVAAVMKEG